jgi:hypothetical protein
MKQVKKTVVLGVVFAVVASLASAQNQTLDGLQPVPQDAFKPRVVRPVPDAGMYLAFPPFQTGGVMTCDAFQKVQPDAAKARIAEAGANRIQAGDMSLVGADGVARLMTATAMVGPSGVVALVPDSGVYREACLQ